MHLKSCKKGFCCKCSGDVSIATQNSIWIALNKRMRMRIIKIKFKYVHEKSQECVKETKTL